MTCGTCAKPLPHHTPFVAVVVCHACFERATQDHLALVHAGEEMEQLRYAIHKLEEQNGELRHDLAAAERNLKLEIQSQVRLGRRFR